MVPDIATASGTILGPVPPLIVPMVTTAGERVRLALRLTTVCTPVTICAEVTMGSMVLHGLPPCPWLPVTLMFNISLAAVVAPVRQLSSPEGPGIRSEE